MKNPQPSSPSSSSSKAHSPQSWRPAYWNKEHGSAWSRVREAFSRDWEQTKNDLTGKGPDLKQDVPDTVKQAAGTEPIPPKGQPNAETDTESKGSWQDAEPGVRYGFGARQQYGKDSPAWDETLEKKLESEWDEEKTGKPFSAVNRFVREGWNQNHPKKD
ncbi:MAG: hypothetical protein Q8S33_01395 [Myxococcales bacterium]|nr:hypothetical protein [Myxococcales bacterium]